MPKRNDWAPDSDNAPTSKILKECALGIGQAAIAWNQLHEELRDLFSDLFAIEMTIHAEEGADMALRQYRRLRRLVDATWNSVGFDRPKRELLKDVLAELSGAAKRRFPKLADDVTWILREANSLEESRNNLIHAPLGVDYHWRKDDMSDFAAIPVPRIYGGNHRALKLMEKDLQAEFIYCRDTAIVLRWFANEVSLHVSVTDPANPERWPKRPPLPTRERQNSRRGRRRPNAQAELSPQDRKHRLEVARQLKDAD
jgi:hypothetical protein